MALGVSELQVTDLSGDKLNVSRYSNGYTVMFAWDADQLHGTMLLLTDTQTDYLANFLAQDVAPAAEVDADA